MRWQPRRSLSRWAGIALLGAFSTIGIQAIAQCDQLHAGLRVNLTAPTPADKADHLQLTFALVNDSDKVIPANRPEWKLFIDGAEVKGVRPAGGGGGATDNSLGPGQWYEFRLLLSPADYFPNGGQHTAQWSGVGFRSPRVTFSLPDEHAM